MPLNPLQGQPLLVFVPTCHLKVLPNIRMCRDIEVHHLNMWDRVTYCILSWQGEFPIIQDSVQAWFAWCSICRGICLSPKCLKVVAWLENIVLSQGCWDQDVYETSETALYTHHTEHYSVQTISNSGVTTTRHIQ